MLRFPTISTHSNYPLSQLFETFTSEAYRHVELRNTAAIKSEVRLMAGCTNVG